MRGGGGGGGDRITVDVNTGIIMAHNGGWGGGDTPFNGQGTPPRNAASQNGWKSRLYMQE